jgi:phosphatidylglycerol:prolipoprotein diacylglycerol transferase
MYPALPFGPFSIPTTPFLAIVAAIVALEIAARFGRRLGLHPDDVWNTGLLALLAGLIVARLWTVIQFRDIYLAEPLLVFSLRPSGFAFWPGLIAAVIAGYANLLRRALAPLPMLAAFAVGAIAGSVVLGASNFLTGVVVGTPSDLPWALPYYETRVHPVGLYRAIASLVVLAWVWLTSDNDTPGRVILKALFGMSLTRLIADAFIADADAVGLLRLNQLVALSLAVGCALALARPPATPTPRPVSATDSGETPG